MNSLAELKNSIRDNYNGLLFIAVIFFVFLFSVSDLTTRPKLWVDEALTLELAHNFERYGELNVKTSPGLFFEYPYLLQSTGYPLTVPLALIFKIFGYSLTTGRIVMLLLMITALFAVYLFGRKMFDKDKALMSVLLFATFASFYGSGRTAVGEIPGFILLIMSLYFLLIKENYYLNGLFLGLAVAMKPSVFLLALPAMIITIFIGRDSVVGGLKNISRFLFASAMPILIWIFLVVGNPFSNFIWNTLLNFYKNPYQAESISSNFVNNLSNFFNSSTLIYFGGLFLIICYVSHYLKEKKEKLLYLFVTLYSILAFIYYLRSPGWLRYILIAEMLILFILPHAIYTISERFNKQYLAVPVIILLLVVQITHLFTRAEIYFSDSAINGAQYINKTFPLESVGVIDSPELSVLLSTEDKYQTFTLLGLPTIGTDFLAGGHRPGVVIYNSDTKLSENSDNVIKSYYKHLESVNGREVFILNK